MRTMVFGCLWGFTISVDFDPADGQSDACHRMQTLAGLRHMGLGEVAATTGTGSETPQQDPLNEEGRTRAEAFKDG